jgi:hypothetical protein
MKLVLVEWYDTCSGDSWDGRYKEEHTSKIVSTGIIVREDKEEIEIVPNMGNSHKLHQIAIPKGCIRRMRQLCIK